MAKLRRDSQALSLTLGQLVGVVSLFFLVLAIGTTLALSSYIQDKAINDLARDDARQTSKLVFESLYSAMRKGWDKQEIKTIIERLNRIQPDMQVRIFRGAPVRAEYGEIEGEQALREADPILQATLEHGQEFLLPAETQVRYVYPVVVQQECLGCHSLAKVGDINGAIDITFPIKDLKISLDFVTDVVIWYFTAVLVLLFLVLYAKLRFFVALPVMDLVRVIKDVTRHADLTRRVGSRSWIAEVGHLADHFNRLLTSLQSYNDQLEELSIRDPLTGLYNRRKFEKVMEVEVRRARRMGEEFTVIMLDVDNFKHINDTFGHPIGDLALRELSLVLDNLVRDTDILARLGGDEFALILPSINQEQGLAVAEKLRTQISTTDIDLPVGKTRLVASFGLVTYPQNGSDTEALFTSMDVAMYRAKRLGKNRIMTFDNAEQQVMMDVFNQGQLVRSALEEGRVLVHLQPIIQVENGTLYACEALARIQHEAHLLHAGQFIDVAEELGMVVDIDQAVFQQALALKAEEPRLQGVRLFINLSAKTMSNVGLMREMAQHYQSYAFPPGEVVFEITEREALPKITELRGLITELHEYGLAFALDDFGSGFSSFLYLKYLQVDYVKIEGSFVRNIALDPGDRIMVDHINQMSHEFGIQTIAEFVEEPQAQEMLQQLGIDYAQGYLYGLPCTVEELTWPPRAKPKDLS